MIRHSTNKADWFDLSAHNTMAVPARSKGLTVVDSVDQLREAIQQAKRASLSYMVLGEGSNTVFVDDYPGLVIVMALTGIEVLEETSDSITVRAAAGENWHKFVEHCVFQGWFGLENLALIPGLVGAAPIQNIGAYGVEVKDSVSHVEVLDIASQAVSTVSNKECQFGYRESRFKQSWAGKKVVTAVAFKLSKEPKVIIEYPELRQRLQENCSNQAPTAPTPQQVFAAVVEIRSKKLPSPQEIPNTGSFFKNPVVDAATHQKLKMQYPNLISYQKGEQFKLAAAWLIDTAGWKTKELDGVKVHEKQALVVTNPLRCNGKAIKNFALAVQFDIQEKFGISLEVEPQLIGE